MEISFETDSSKGIWDVLNRAVLKELKINQQDIESVKLDYFAISNYPYEEKNVARCTHACEGSIGHLVYMKDGTQHRVEDIFFYDYNPYKTHEDGLPHWNHEGRLDGQKAKAVEHHIIPDSSYIKIKVTDKGVAVIDKIVRCVPINQVRKQK